MRRMGIEALYRRPRTTKPEPGHKIYPYLLRGMAITRPNQVWAMDITYIPMARGFVYLAVVLDWFSRRVLSWRVSITMEAAFCVATLEDALARHGKPDIFRRIHPGEIERHLGARHPIAMPFAAKARSSIWIVYCSSGPRLVPPPREFGLTVRIDSYSVTTTTPGTGSSITSMIVVSTGACATPLSSFVGAFLAAVFGGFFFLATGFVAVLTARPTLDFAFVGAARFAAFLRAGFALALPRFELFFATRFFALAMAVSCGGSPRQVYLEASELC